MNVYNIEEENVYLVGDIHGLYLSFAVDMAEPNSCYIFLGDFGIGFEKVNKNLMKAHHRLKKKNSRFIAFRGNHDDPDQFNTPKNEYDNIQLIPDYSVITWKDKVMLCIGGGISIDRIYRIPTKNYWENEPIVYDENKLNEILDKYSKIDYLLTHIGSLYKGNYNGLVYQVMFKDKELKSDLDAEHDVYQKILDRLKPYNVDKCFHGHYHTYIEYTYDNYTIICLNMYRLGEKTYFIYDLNNDVPMS